MVTQNVAPVVVGVDGSADARGAVDYAAWEAHRLHRPLRLVFGFQPIPVYGPSLAGDTIAWPLRQARVRLTDLADTIIQRHPDLSVVTAVIAGSPAGVLIDESRKASLIVVGSRGLGGFSGLLLGSVGGQVAMHAHCPVIVLRPPSAEALRPQPDTGRVVVGVDGSPEAARALGFAFEEAAGRKVPLVVVHAWRYASTVDGGRSVAERLVEDALAGWTEKYPHVPARRHVVPGDSAAHALLDESVGAGLLVVGARGRGGFAGLRLGSVGHALVGHARVPVAIVHGG